MGYTILHAAELNWKPRFEGDPRLVAELSDAMTKSRANLFRYPPGAVRRLDDALLAAISDCCSACARSRSRARRILRALALFLCCDFSS